MIDPKTTGNEGKELIRKVEGLSLTIYPDSGGAPTIGIGHLLTKSERLSGKIQLVDESIKYANGITIDQAYKILEFDLKKAEAAVRVGVNVSLTQNQFDALVSFTFNVGSTAFLSSTLLKSINLRKDDVFFQWRRWKYDNGKVVQGLVNRREFEIDLWCKS